MFEVSVSGSFEASYFVGAESGPGASRRAHGHSFIVTASVAGLAPGGWALDLGPLGRALKDVLGELDHSLLNDIPGLEEPTFETLLVWIDGKLKAKGYAASRIEIERPTVRQRAIYTPAR